MSTTEQTTTPRSDAVRNELRKAALANEIQWATAFDHLYDFARQLEAELTAAHATIEELRRERDQLPQKIAQLLSRTIEQFKRGETIQCRMIADGFCDFQK